MRSDVSDKNNKKEQENYVKMETVETVDDLKEDSYLRIFTPILPYL